MIHLFKIDIFHRYVKLLERKHEHTERCGKPLAGFSRSMLRYERATSL